MRKITIQLDRIAQRQINNYVKDNKLIWESYINPGENPDLGTLIKRILDIDDGAQFPEISMLEIAKMEEVMEWLNIHGKSYDDFSNAMKTVLQDAATNE